MTWFRIDEPFVNFARSMSLIGLDQLKSLKSMLYQRVSGFKGAIPKYLRGQDEVL